MNPWKSESLNEEVGYRRGFTQAVMYLLWELGARDHPYISEVIEWRHGNQDPDVLPPQINDDDILQIRKLIRDHFKND